jgi:hypothetical protein
MNMRDISFEPFLVRVDYPIIRENHKRISRPRGLGAYSIGWAIVVIKVMFSCVVSNREC